MLKKFTQWIIYSSNNPQEYALTLKAGIPFLVLLGLGNYTADATTLIDSTTNFLIVIGQTVTAVLTIYGILRKILLTAKANMR